VGRFSFDQLYGSLTEDVSPEIIRSKESGSGIPLKDTGGLEGDTGSEASDMLVGARGIVDEE